MLCRVALALVVLTAGSTWAQSVISAHSGVINYTEGQVQLDGKSVRLEPAKITDVKTGQTLSVEDGRAEVLLTPGVFLRLNENSSFKMLSSKLSDTRVEILTGTALIEVGELLQDNAITVAFQDATIELAKKGLYRIDADSARLRVYDGEAHVTSGTDVAVVAKKGREVLLGAVLQAHNFDTKQSDEFNRWSARRDQYVAQANVSAARTTGNYSSGYTSIGSGTGSGSWAWNPWFGMFTFIPYNGMYYSPYGYYYFSPRTVWSVYQPYYGNFGNAYGSGRAAAVSSATHTDNISGYTVGTRSGIGSGSSMGATGGGSIGNGGGVSRGIGGGSPSSGAPAGGGGIGHSGGSSGGAGRRN